MKTEEQTSDSRSGQDRRKRWLPSIRALLLHPRRRSLRRLADRRRFVLLDRYKKSMRIPVILVLVLSALDAFLTLFLLEHGAIELNPVMAYFIEKGPHWFISAKYLITAVAVTIAVIIDGGLVSSLKVIVRDLLTLFAGLFSLVIGWEIFLLVRYVL